MRFGHMGDAFEMLRTITEEVPAGHAPRVELEEFARELARLTGAVENLQAVWPEICNEL